MYRRTVLVALLVVACGGAPSSGTPASSGGQLASTAPASVPASAASASGAPAVAPVQFSETQDPAAAAKKETELTHQLREDSGFAPLIGANGATAFTELDATEEAYAHELIADIAAAIDAGQLPQASPAALAGQLASVGRPLEPSSKALGGIDISLFADTGFTASALMTLYAQIVQRAAESGSGSLPRQESFDKTSDGLRQQVDLGTTITVQTGGGRVTADIIMSATDRITDPATGSFIALYTSRTTGHFEVNACPDAGGVAEGTYTFETKHELNDVSAAEASRSGAGRSVNAPFRLIDGENAHLVQIEAALDMTADGRGPGSPSGPGPTEPFDWGATQAVQIVMPVSGSTTVTGTGSSVTGTGGERSSGAMLVSSAMAQLFLSEVAKEAERFWRSGECVEITTNEESRDVEPSEEVEIVAEALGKFDHEEIQAPIKASFNGKESLDPDTEPQDPPASFTFKAGAEKDDKGTIDFEQVGRRGIGKKQLVFTVGASDYRVSSAQTAIGGISGTKCDGLAGPWTLQWHGQGATAASSTTFTLPEGGGTAPAHTDLVLDFGQAKSVYSLDGSASASVRDDGTAVLNFLLGSGKVTVSAQGQSHTTSISFPASLYELEAGDFC